MCQTLAAASTSPARGRVMRHPDKPLINTRRVITTIPPPCMVTSSAIDEQVPARSTTLSRLALSRCAKLHRARGSPATGLQPTFFGTVCYLVCQQTNSVTCCPSKRGRERQRGRAGRGIAMKREQRPQKRSFMSPTTEKLHWQGPRAKRPIP